MDMDDMDMRITYSFSIVLLCHCFDWSTTCCDQAADKLFDLRGHSKLPLWQLLVTKKIMSKDAANMLHLQIQQCARQGGANHNRYRLKQVDGSFAWYSLVCVKHGNEVSVVLSDINDTMLHRQHLAYDETTGLLNSRSFKKAADELLSIAPAGEYAVLYLDVARFKAINDVYGVQAGEKLLRHIAFILQQELRQDELCCCWGVDRFVYLAHRQNEQLQKLIESIVEKLQANVLPVDIVCNIGVYVETEEVLPLTAMIDRASLAQAAIKDSYTKKYYFYHEGLRKRLLCEQEIVGMMSKELDKEHFVVYFQPQYNHAKGSLIGAEALVRWQHPERGLISPGTFIPVFEKNGFITRMDMYVFKETCRFIRACLDRNLNVVPISSNFSRYDIYQPGFVEELESIRQCYNVPVSYLRLEITESAIMGTGEKANAIIDRLHDCGYMVEMDDFGSEYSSLNVLHNISLDVLKLDMLFLSKQENNKKGSTIIKAIINMAHMLNLPVIAEGVETEEQAEFLHSIGCDYYQGYLYSRPMPGHEFASLLAIKELDTIQKPQDKLS